MAGGGRVDWALILDSILGLSLAWMSRDGSDRINGLFHLLINGVYIGVITH